MPPGKRRLDRPIRESGDVLQREQKSSSRGVSPIRPGRRCSDRSPNECSDVQQRAAPAPSRGVSPIRPGKRGSDRPVRECSDVFQREQSPAPSPWVSNATPRRKAQAFDPLFCPTSTHRAAHVWFNSPLNSVIEISTPYSRIYGVHPRFFDFDACGAMEPTPAACSFISALPIAAVPSPAVSSDPQVPGWSSVATSGYSFPPELPLPPSAPPPDLRSAAMQLRPEVAPQACNPIIAERAVNDHLRPVLERAVSDLLRPTSAGHMFGAPAVVVGHGPGAVGSGNAPSSCPAVHVATTAMGAARTPTPERRQTEAVQTPRCPQKAAHRSAVADQLPKAHPNRAEIHAAVHHGSSIPKPDGNCPAKSPIVTSIHGQGTIRHHMEAPDKSHVSRLSTHTSGQHFRTEAVAPVTLDRRNLCYRSALGGA